MPFEPAYSDQEPTREQIEQTPGPVVLEFGASWCGFCQALEPDLKALLQSYPSVRHIRIADGKGKPLGRSFRVKLWPTLVFLRDGQTVQVSVRPEAEEVHKGLQAISTVAQEGGAHSPE